jgi:hypothetical protein
MSKATKFIENVGGKSEAHSMRLTKDIVANSEWMQVDSDTKEFAEGLLSRKGYFGWNEDEGEFTFGDEGIGDYTVHSSTGDTAFYFKINGEKLFLVQDVKGALQLVDAILNVAEVGRKVGS